MLSHRIFEPTCVVPSLDVYVIKYAKPRQTLVKQIVITKITIHGVTFWSQDCICMASLRSVVAQIQRVSNQADGERLPSLHPSLLELEDVLGSRGNENSVKLNVEEIVDALRTLDVRQHQLGYLWLLYVDDSLVS